VDKYCSKIGLGCVTFGREIDRAASFALMDDAQRRGITFFDTASAYGSGRSESIVADWLASRRHHTSPINIATKIQPPYEPEHIMRSVDQSLMRLDREQIDVLYLHRWDATIEMPEALETLSRLVSGGKVRTLGASNFNADQLYGTLQRQKTAGLECFSAVQNNHNLAVSDISKEFRQICTLHGISIFTYSPLGAGFLTGKYQEGIAEDTRFGWVPGHQDVYFNAIAFRRLKRLQIVAARTGCTPAHLALAWALHQPGINSVLVGCRTHAHLSQAFDALAYNDPEIFAELESG